MLTYIWRQELVPLFVIDPVLHYYPLLACYNEPRAPATAWRTPDGLIGGSLLPCDPPGRAWLTAASAAAVEALVQEVPGDMTITIPMWADSIVRAALPNRSLSSEVLAVCTPSSLRRPQSRAGVRLEILQSLPGVEENPEATPLQVTHIGCIIGESLAGFCSYHIDGRGGASIERLVISSEWLAADIGKTLLAGATATVLEYAERVIFGTAGDNVALLGVARSVGFRTCYWLRSASAETTPSPDRPDRT